MGFAHAITVTSNRSSDSETRLYKWLRCVVAEHLRVDAIRMHQVPALARSLTLPSFLPEKFVSFEHVLPRKTMPDDVVQSELVIARLVCYAQSLSRTVGS